MYLFLMQNRCPLLLNTMLHSVLSTKWFLFDLFYRWRFSGDHSSLAHRSPATVPTTRRP